MPNLLHLDASIRTENSNSRILSAAFVEEWRRLYPEAGIGTGTSRSIRCHT